MLRHHLSPEVPLLVHVSSASMTSGFVVYNCTVSSCTSKKGWSVSFRYSEFDAFREKLENQWTCYDPNCFGSCQAVREIIAAFFPKKCLPVMSSFQCVVTSRKLKFEVVLTHLLRCVLLPGSAMKCRHARQNLPDKVFEFLGVKSDADRRSVLQVFIDNYQDLMKKNSTTHLMDIRHSHSTTVGCMICLCDVDLAHGHQQCDNSLIVLPCEHMFHRKCVFQWLLFQTHCPVCRVRVCPKGVTNHCRSKRHAVQWWLSDFDGDLLCTKRMSY
ncbi:RING finger ubiquitin ligase [Phytophthora cinnamomi]|uniref:RING finger ubiquitin ligase n=1 Tax=Phytophthora cinnamomi TaxID=4785 RepID=UPI0035599C24|nr:RING finger ubiquitin ligase [Phytophthora cinnamomi]